MSQLRIWDFGAPRKSEYLNNHFIGVVPTKRVYRGYNVAETSPASLNLDINLGSESSVLMTDQGVRIEETANILNAVTIAPHATLDRIDWVLAAHEYTNSNNPQTYEVLEGTAAPTPIPPASVPAHKVLLATVYVPAGATAITNDLINISESVVLSSSIDRSGFLELRPDPQSAISNTVFVNAGTYVKSDGTDVVTVADDVANAVTFPVVSGAGKERYDLLAIDDAGVASRIAGAEAATGLGDAPAYPTDKQVVGEILINEDTDVRITQSDIRDVRFFFNLGGGGGGGGTGAAVMDSEPPIVATAAQSVFNLTTITYDITKAIIVAKNGQVLNANEYVKTSSTIVTLVSAAHAGDIIEVYAINAVAFINAIAWHLFDSMTIGQTVLNLPFSYTTGLHHLFAIRNGAELIVDEPGSQGFTESSSTSITLNTPVSSIGERIVVYKISSVTGSLNHKMAFHDDAAAILAPGQTYRNLRLNSSNNTQINIQPGAVLADSWTEAISLPVLIIDITASGINGLDIGAEAPNTWYYIWVIKNPTTSVVGGLLSASPTSPTLPAGFTLKRLIGAIRNDGSSNLRPFTQIDDEVLLPSGLTALTGIFGPTAPTLLDLSSFVPTISIMPRVFIFNVTQVVGTAWIFNIGNPNLVMQRLVINNNVISAANSNTAYVHSDSAQTVAWSITGSGSLGNMNLAVDGYKLQI